MAFFTAASKADFQHQLQAALAQHISEQALPQVALFAEQFFGIISLDELTQRRLSDLAGCTLSPGACLSASITRNRKCASTTLITNVMAGSRPTPRSKCCTTTCRSWSTRCAPS
jgi:NAD-specific glutamate dehydrogenase